MNTQKIIQFNSSKTCFRCKEEKSMHDFSYRSTSKDNCNAICKTCVKNARKNAGQEIGDKNYGNKRPVEIIEGGRICLSCKKGRPWAEFHTDIHGYNGKTARCNDCRNVKGRQIYKDNPTVRRIGMKNRPDKLKRVYGVTYEHVVRTLTEQHGLCANRACGKEINLEVKGTASNRAVIDHNHKTGKFRALLCVHCNSSLGLIETKRNMMLGLIDYLIRHNHKE